MKIETMKKTFKHLVLLTLLLGLGSCADEQFAPQRQDESSQGNPIQHTSNTSCSSFTLVKPQVDFLFLWDNSTSSVFINSQTKTALNNTIDLISSRFDYHILLAPLVINSSNVNHEARLISDTPAGLSSSALGMKIDRSFATAYLDTFTPAAGSYEEGVKRSADIIKANISNGVFRPNSHLIIVVMSNQDDSSWHGFPVAAADRINYINQQAHRLLCVRGSYNPTSGFCTGSSLNSLQMRFMSITAFNPSGGGNSCGGITSWNKGTTYQDMSRKIYLAPYTNGFQPMDQSFDSTPDAYDICSQSNFAHIFDGINSSINSTLLSHRYDYWPVATSGSAPIDPAEVRVFKDGTEIPRVFPPVPAGVSGFSYDNTVHTMRNTRYAPSPGEPFTGYVVRLHGNARVTYPECMNVRTQTPKEYFAYVQLQGKPLESSISLRINGVTIPNSTTNGWQLIKQGSQPRYYNSFNIKIQSPGSFCPSSSTNYCPGSPAVNKSGYFLKLYGSAIYSNGDQIDISYDPAG